MNRIFEFMSGRNGNDQLGLALLVVALILNIIFRMTGMYLLGIAAMALVLIVLYRMFSRDLAKRREENRRFLSLWSDAKRSFAEWRLRRSRRASSSISRHRLRQAVKDWGGSQPAEAGLTNW